MPIYDVICTHCGWQGEIITPYEHMACCPNCDSAMKRLVSAPTMRMAGRIPKGGGPDKFTADVLGIPLKELPEGLKS